MSKAEQAAGAFLRIPTKILYLTHCRPRVTSLLTTIPPSQNSIECGELEVIQDTFENVYDTFHNRLSPIHGSDQRFNSAQALVSPRICSSPEDIYPGPRCISGIHELLGKAYITDPQSSRLRRAYRIHVKGRNHDDWVWASDLEQDIRYSQMVAQFECSSSIFGQRFQPYKWALDKLASFKATWIRTFSRIPESVSRPAIHKRLYIEQDEQGEETIAFR
ncbi:hypothetical protein BDZ91DRAFT_797088 [Kalaharituber pfeilii]|nr:hypothetical protein BDZ91DRAFT_797088 [Kalaharituber pfeilii]